MSETGAGDSGTLLIRPMTLADTPAVHAIDVACFSLPWPERSFRFEVSENKASRCWVVEYISTGGEAQIVGALVLWLILDEAHIGTLGVLPEFRRHGSGRRLLAEALLAAYADGARRVFLEVRRSNIPAQALYQRFGFEIVGVRKRYYSDNYEDALLMNLDPIDPEALTTLLHQQKS